MWEIHLSKNGKIKQFIYSCGILQYNGMQFLDDDSDKFKERSALCMCMNYIRNGWSLRKCTNMPDLYVHPRPRIISFTKQYIGVPHIDLVKDNERYVLLYNTDVYVYVFHTKTFWKQKKEITLKNHIAVMNQLYNIPSISTYCEFYIHDGNIWLVPQSLIHYHKLMENTSFISMYMCPLVHSKIQVIPAVKILRDLHACIDYYL